ncbi:MAG: bifunctional diaminohydroxyphosphoribosylaminopyrimidine deaminase/5-amino-6-(5-phosphoribosylamino)uracil reductase RibD [Thermotaleaceae bacterium]
MQKALTLAKHGLGYVNPNPLVGAVIVKEGRIIGEGYHAQYGQDHAEIHAFKQATEDVKGATLYVTLEPCSHYGKTPPCAKAIVEKGIKKVVIAMTDPNPLVAGKGIQFLQEAGIEICTGVLEKEAKKLNEIFIKYITTAHPFCTLKTAMTLDGKIATSRRDSRWVTGEAAREIVHQLRHQYSGIMVGIGTILADDPLLTTRLNGTSGKNPIRIILDSTGRIPLQSKVLQCNQHTKTIVAVTEEADRNKLTAIESSGAEIILTPTKDQQVDLAYLMKILGEKKIDSILLEGGSSLNYSAICAGVVDKVIAFIAPKIIGGASAPTPIGGEGIQKMEDAISLKDITAMKIGEDLMLEAYLREGV